jgi:hypothetical protein
MIPSLSAIVAHESATDDKGGASDVCGVARGSDAGLHDLAGPAGVPDDALSLLCAADVIDD